ncbi:MAG: glutamine synthetase [Candidatus Sericytochromatia bacterium]|nr:glutamine synthetase [Candidatus Sericytochromatia bacterium]
MGKTTAEILAEIEQDPNNRVKVAVSDIDGILRGKYMHKQKFLSAAQDSFGFCNVVMGWDSSDACYDNVSYTGLHTGYPDALAKIDLSTLRHVPWDDKVPFFLGDFWQDADQPLAICPRQTLKRVLKQAADQGFLIKAGMEFEWFNYRETPQSLADKDYADPQPLTPGMFGYSLIRPGQNRPFFKAMLEELEAFGIPLEGLHTETGPGVLEAAMMVTDALEAADRAILFKTSIKEIAARFGIMPSFMAKPSVNLPGCSGHIHQSLWSADEQTNLFYQADHSLRMSPLFEHYLAGQLYCLPEILPMYAPTVNSYKRLVEGYWAPTRPSWGVDNRTTALRVIPGSPKSTRIEVRISGSDVNPYLAMAAAVASGLYGVQKRLKLDAPAVQGNAYAAAEIERLPNNLWHATERMRQSELAREILGEAFVTHFCNTRLWEWQQFQQSVTDWEVRRYFEII